MKKILRASVKFYLSEFYAMSSRKYTKNYTGNRNYYRGSNSIRAVTQKKSFTTSASNMTQNGLFSISVRDTIKLSIPANSLLTHRILDLPALIAASPMHRQLSNVFDQYKIEKSNLKFRMASCTDDIDATTNIVGSFFTCVDRSDFSNQISVDMLRTYQSYKETAWPLNGDRPITHAINVGQSNVVEKNQYYDSKKIAAFPAIAVGFAIPVPFGDISSDILNINVSLEIDAQVRYRGVRLDTSSGLSVTNLVPHNNAGVSGSWTRIADLPNNVTSVNVEAKTFGTYLIYIPSQEMWEIGVLMNTTDNTVPFAIDFENKRSQGLFMTVSTSVGQRLDVIINGTIGFNLQEVAGTSYSISRFYLASGYDFGEAYNYLNSKKTS